MRDHGRARLNAEYAVLTAEQVRAGDERTVIKRQIERLVYELYGLTDEEIAIVEEATGKDE